jgi:hypothetical protein
MPLRWIVVGYVITAEVVEKVFNRHAVFGSGTAVRVSFDGDETSDSVVRGIRQDVSLYQLCLAVIGPALDDLLGECYAHARQRNELLD